MCLFGQCSIFHKKSLFEQSYAAVPYLDLCRFFLVFLLIYKRKTIKVCLVEIKDFLPEYAINCVCLNVAAKQEPREQASANARLFYKSQQHDAY